MIQNENPATKQLSNKLGQYIPLKHFLITAFSRNAFLLLIKAYAWEKPDEIIIPAFTCPVIRHTVEAANVIAVAVDAEKDGLNIDPEQLEKAITPNTKGIYVVHTYGTVAQMTKICAIAKAHNLIVIEDLAHSLFSSHNGKQMGTYGDFAILSFTKQIIDFEGGAIATNNTEIYEKMLLIRGQLQQPGPFSPGGLLDSYVRMVGSWWESGFSLLSLAMMKFHDKLNSLIFKGSYGISIDYSKFFISSMGSRLVLIQLDRLYKKKQKLSLKQQADIKDSTQEEPFAATPYNVGMASKQERFNVLLSFRTWHNPNQLGRYPRADELHANLRIYSKAKSIFGETAAGVTR